MKVKDIILAILTILSLILGGGALARTFPVREEVAIEAQGSTSGNWTVGGSITAGTGATVTSGGLTVTAGGATITAGDVDVASGNVILSSDNYPIEHASAGREVYFNVTSAFTGTTTVLSTTTGISTVVAVLCDIDDPDDDAGDAFICKAAHSDGDVTITAEDDEGATSSEADTTAFYIIAGY